MSADSGDEPRRILVGGICPRGGRDGHAWTYDDDEEDGACGSKSWPLYVEYDPEDWHRLPEWVKALDLKAGQRG